MNVYPIIFHMSEIYSVDFQLVTQNSSKYTTDVQVKVLHDNEVLFFFQKMPLITTTDCIITVDVASP